MTSSSVPVAPPPLRRPSRRRVAFPSAPAVAAPASSVPECLQPQPGTDVLPPETLRVLIGFDDQAAFQRAMRLCVRVFSEFDGGLDVRPVPWSFNYLSLPEWRTLARADASKADILIIAVSRVDELPAAVGDWVELCCAAPRTASAMLVALVGDPADTRPGPTRVRSYLRSIAEREGLSFLAP